MRKQELKGFQLKEIMSSEDGKTKILSAINPNDRLLETTQVLLELLEALKGLAPFADSILNGNGKIEMDELGHALHDANNAIRKAEKGE